jgi:hypothetical protein
MHQVQSAIPQTGLARIAALRHKGFREDTGVKTMKPSISRLFHRLFPMIPTRADRELAYLRGSVSRYDLESREREIARGKFAAY